MQSRHAAPHSCERDAMVYKVRHSSGLWQSLISHQMTMGGGGPIEDEHGGSDLAALLDDAKPGSFSQAGNQRAEIRRRESGVSGSVEKSLSAFLQPPQPAPLSPTSYTNLESQ